MHYLNKCKYLILRVLLSILFIFLDLNRSMSTVQVLMIYVEDDWHLDAVYHNYIVGKRWEKACHTLFYFYFYIMWFKFTKA